MTAEILRRATAEIREDWPENRFHRAVADLLDCYAAVMDAGHPIAFENQALTVARTYLGESA